MELTPLYRIVVVVTVLSCVMLLSNLLPVVVSGRASVTGAPLAFAAVNGEQTTETALKSLCGETYAKRADNHARYFISFESHGRLGNQMYQYAALLATACRTGRWPLLGRRFHALRAVFDLSLPLSPPRMLRNFQKVKIGKVKQWLNDTYNLVSNATSNVTLIGYPNSVKYFAEIKHIVRREFTFRKQIIRKAKSFHRKLNNSHGVSVGVHIRGTDENVPGRIRLGYCTPHASYYLNAMEGFRQNSTEQRVHFIVCTDDPKLARRMIDENRDDVTFSLGNGPGVDLAILSLCDHVIVGQTSSFGEFASWFVNGTTVKHRVKKHELQQCMVSA